jgi:hypothetical protein
LRYKTCAGWSLLVVAGRRLRHRWAALFALAPDAASRTAAAATATAVMPAFLLLSVARAGIGGVTGEQLFRIIRLLVRSHKALAIATIVAGTLVFAIGVLRFAAALALRILLVVLLLSGALVWTHLAVAMTALLIVGGVLLLFVAAMTMARERRGEALADVRHIDVGDRDFASADSRSLALVLRRYHAIIMIGMLEEVLRRHAVAGGTGIACELKILL